MTQGALVGSITAPSIVNTAMVLFNNDTIFPLFVSSTKGERYVSWH